MLKRTIFCHLLIGACVTVNIYFPGGGRARRRPNRQGNLGGPDEPAKPAPKPQSRSLFSPARIASVSFAAEASAQEADINVSNPASAR